MGTTHHQGTGGSPSTPNGLIEKPPGPEHQTPTRLPKSALWKVYALTSPNFDMRLLGDLEDEGVVVIPLTGQEFDFIMAQYQGGRGV